ncbi:hypothetical protein NP511_17920 [Natrinema thermotolerans]|uniref:Uncharacterized protein n=1 Tax=Natrinema thermotolerans TaxID=121872 RepID=A0AAF0P8B0_9EURY|nr:hypothetical protein [Natrinema thermotolerans]QCC60236.1 hypothetical protein DVR14_17000 [Natrinema thermotolerans]QCC61147.1 hypothetical protein DVR14_21125 [Natrinema thermotolerans]WMT07253.1 hypothetical protein NP511_17920 [Natrinema thermotolerans]
MILRRWIVEWLQDSPAGPIIEGNEASFRTLFGGVIDPYRAAEESLTVDPGQIDLVLSFLFTGIYVAGVIAMMYFGMNLLSYAKAKVTGVGFTDRGKVVVAGGIWAVLTTIDSVLRGQVFVWEMTKKNTEWIFVVRQILTGNTDIQAGLDLVAFGLLEDPVVEVGAMLVISLIMISALSHYYVPVIDSAGKLFVTLFTGSLLAYVTFPRLGIDVFPVDIWPVFVGHVLFAWLVVGTLFALVLGKVWRAASDFIAGQWGVFEQPDMVKYTRDGTVFVLLPLAFLHTSYTATLSLFAWFSYKLAVDRNLWQKVLGTQSDENDTSGIPSREDCEPENWNDEQGICEIGD